MPYKIKGKSVVKADTDKLVGRSKNPKKYVKTLRAIEHGWTPTEKTGNWREYITAKKRK